MKKIILLLLLSTSFNSFSQDTDEPVQIRFDLPSNGSIDDADRTRIFTAKGSPYIKETYQQGFVVNGKNKTAALLRYNAYYDRFQFLDENNKKTFVLKSPNIKIELDGKTYELLTYKITVQDKALYYLPEGENEKTNKNNREGYFSSLTEGKTMLYTKTSKRLPKFQLPENGYDQFEPTELRTLVQYYLKRKNRPATRIRLSKKEVLFALNDKYDELRSYIKENKLKVKSEEEVIQIISYYDTLN
ncbi:MAG: hypothetical protein AB8B59_03365 [Maribacter sp.]